MKEDPKGRHYRKENQREIGNHFYFVNLSVYCIWKGFLKMFSSYWILYRLAKGNHHHVEYIKYQKYRLSCELNYLQNVLNWAFSLKHYSPLTNFSTRLFWDNSWGVQVPSRRRCPFLHPEFAHTSPLFSNENVPIVLSVFKRQFTYRKSK